MCDIILEKFWNFFHNPTKNFVKCPDGNHSRRAVHRGRGDRRGIYIGGGARALLPFGGVFLSRAPFGARVRAPVCPVSDAREAPRRSGRRDPRALRARRGRGAGGALVQCADSDGGHARGIGQPAPRFEAAPLLPCAGADRRRADAGDEGGRGAQCRSGARAPVLCGVCGTRGEELLPRRPSLLRRGRGGRIALCRDERLSDGARAHGRRRADEASLRRLRPCGERGRRERARHLGVHISGGDGGAHRRDALFICDAGRRALLRRRCARHSHFAGGVSLSAASRVRRVGGARQKNCREGQRALRGVSALPHGVGRHHSRLLSHRRSGRTCIFSSLHSSRATFQEARRGSTCPRRAGTARRWRSSRGRGGTPDRRTR